MKEQFVYLQEYFDDLSIELLFEHIIYEGKSVQVSPEIAKRVYNKVESNLSVDEKKDPKVQSKLKKLKDWLVNNKGTLISIGSGVLGVIAGIYGHKKWQEHVIKREIGKIEEMLPKILFPKINQSSEFPNEIIY